MKIGLIGCVKTKKEGTHKASRLYTSTLFKYSYKYIKSFCDRVYILSAKYELVHEDEIIENYEKTLNNMKVFNRRLWSYNIECQLHKELISVNDPQIYVIAGKKYYEFWIDNIPWEVEILGEGLPLGKKLQFLKERIESGYNA